MPGRYSIPDWTPVDIIPVLIPSVAGIAYGIYLLAFPPPTSLGRKISTIFLGIPVFFGFRYSDHVGPSFDICDTFARTSLIWYAHMSYELCILEFTPDVQPGPGEIKERLRQACKVFYDRSRTQVLEDQRKRAMKSAANETKSLLPQNGDDTMTDKKTDEPTRFPSSNQKRTALAHYQHGYTRWQLVGYHLTKAVIYYTTYNIWDKYVMNFSPVTSNFWVHIGSHQIPFFSRLPSGLDWYEIWWRIEETITWSLVGKWFYESFHSTCATLSVGLGIDGPDEWSLHLFGQLRDAWTVRRYWGKYWHNFIYHSFMGHVKCVTRGWMGMKRGRLATRLVENTLVFFFSGLMHSLVRWQQEPQSDMWSVTLLYTAQMIPIVVESIVAFYWRKVRRALGYGPEAKWVDRMEYAVGYFWCFAWFFYCVPTYWLVRDKWTEAKMRKANLAKHGPDALNETVLNEMELEE